MGIKRWFQDKIGIGENRDRLDFLEKRIKINQQLIPEVLEMNAKNRPLKIFDENELLREKINFAVHKNDIMLVSILFHHSGLMNVSLNEYFGLGWRTATQLKSFAGDTNVGSFLDFGAGYGRISRFLPFVFEGAKIVTTDIKPESVAFNKKVLRLDGIVHGTEPSSADFSAGYDFVFAGSVFTHLPKTMSEAWLDVLADATNTGGKLVITTHNIERYGHALRGDFHYTEVSEDAFFDWIEDSIKTKNTYGSAFVSDALATRWLESRGFSVEIVPRGFGNTQDYIVGTKK